MLQTWKKLITESDVCVFLPLCPSIDTSRAHIENTPQQPGHMDLSVSSRSDTFSVSKYSLQHLDSGLGGADGRGAVFRDEGVRDEGVDWGCWCGAGRRPNPQRWDPA